MRQGIKKRIDHWITKTSSKDSDGDLLKEFSDTLEYKTDEFSYVKEKLERKYDFEFRRFHKRAHSVEEWHKTKDSLTVKEEPIRIIPATPIPKSKTTKITMKDWSKTSVSELSPEQALERFRQLKAEEKRQKLLEEVRNMDLII